MRFAVVAALACVCLWPADAEAACNVSVWSSVSFGTYDVFAAAPLDSAGRIGYRCDQGHNYTIRISITRGQASSYSARALHSGTDVLQYNLFLDAARTVVWGDESEGTQAYYDSGVGLSRDNIPLFGRVYPGQDIRAGVYSDSVMVVIDF